MGSLLSATASAKTFSFEELAKLSSHAYGIVPAYEDIDAEVVHKNWVKVCVKGATSADIRCRGADGIWNRKVTHGSSVFRPIAVIADGSGMQAAAFTHVGSGRTVLAFVGTNDMGDGGADAALAITAVKGMPEVYRRTGLANLFQSIAGYIIRSSPQGADLSDLTVTGHSLGGFHAQMLGYHTKVKRVVTFNAPGAMSSIETLGWRTPKTPVKNVLNVVLGADEVGNYGRTFGGRTHYPQRHWPFALHGIGKVEAAMAAGKTRFRGRTRTNQRLTQGKLCHSSLLPTQKFKMVACPLAVGTKFHRDRSGYIYTGSLARAGTKCLTAGNSRGNDVELQHCEGSRQQIWTRKGATLVNAHQGLCLDRSGSTGRLITWNCNGGANQTFRWK